MSTWQLAAQGSVVYTVQYTTAGSQGVCSVHCTVHYSWQPRGLKCTVYIEFNTAVHPTGTLQVCTLYYTLYCILDCSLCCALHCILDGSLYCTLYCTLQLTAQRSVGKAAPRTALYSLLCIMYSLLCIMYTDLYIRYTFLCIMYIVICNMFTVLCILYSSLHYEKDTLYNVYSISCTVHCLLYTLNVH